MATGLSDIGTKVYIKTSPATTYSAFLSVNKIGAIGGSPDKHESTCLDDLYKTYELGRSDTNEVEFGYNYTSANATTVKAKMDGTNEHTIMVVFPDKSGYELVGKGTDTTSDASVNSLLQGTFTFVIKTKTWSADLTAKIPA